LYRANKAQKAHSNCAVHDSDRNLAVLPEKKRPASRAFRTGASGAKLEAIFLDDVVARIGQQASEIEDG
jgi:hypothetical protein